MRTRIWVTVTSGNGGLPVLVDDDLQPIGLPLRYVMDRVYFNKAWRNIESIRAPHGLEFPLGVLTQAPCRPYALTAVHHTTLELPEARFL